MNPGALFIFIALGIIVAVDVVLTRWRGYTISENTASFVRRYPLAGLAVTTAIGVLLGHMFWAQYPCGSVCPDPTHLEPVKEP